MTEKIMTNFPDNLQQKNFICLLLLLIDISIVSNKIKFHILAKGKVKVNKDIIKRLIK